MKIISNIFVVTAVMIGVPLIFYFAFHGIGANRVSDLEGADSGYKIIDNDRTSYDLDLYIAGVLPGEIESDTSFEAIKAQAVIIRTSILRQMNGRKQIDQKDLTEQMFSKEQLIEKIGNNGYGKVKEIYEKAVAETVGKALVSKGNYILPLYHAVSIGTTASAKELYGKNIPYLTSVDSTSDVEAKDYMQVESWKYEDAIAMIKKKRSSTSLTRAMLETKVMISEKTKSGYVKKLKVGKESFTGEEWRHIFGLNSTNFYIEDYENQLRMIVLGKGHGLGLSQYGANEMAKKGASYKKILEHYYNGAELIKSYGS